MNLIEELKRLAAADSKPEATRLVLIEATWEAPVLTFKTSELPRLQPHIYIPRGVPDLPPEDLEDWH